MADDKVTEDPPPVEDDDDDDEDLFGGGDDDDEDTPKPSEDATTTSTATVDSSVKTETAAAAAAPVAAPAPAPAPVADLAPVPAAAAAPTPAAASQTEVTGHIPRKSQNTNNSVDSSLPSNYGLPPGLKIPASVHEKNLLRDHPKIVEALKKIPVELMNESLTEYDDAVQIKGSSIRNHSAYLFGVIKRYVDVQETRGASLMQASITPAVQRKLDELVRTGYCTHEEMNEKVKGKIRMLNERDALIALDELASSPRSGIRNFGSYLMGIIVKRHRSSEKQGGPGGDSHSRSHSDSRPRRDSDDRYYRDRDRGDSYRRDRDRDSRSRDRERSRDRHDDRRNDHYRRDRDRDRDGLSAYGPGPSQHQNQGFSNQPPPMQGQPPPHMSNMNSYSQQPNQPSYMQQNQHNAYPPPNSNQQQQQFVPPHQMGNMPPPMNQQNRNYPPQNQTYQNQGYPPQNPPGMPPPNVVGQPPQNNMMQPQMGQGQPPLQQSYNQQQPPYMMNQPGNQMMNQQQQPPYIQQQNPMGGAPHPPPNQRGPNSYGNAPGGGWQQQQGPGSYGQPPGNSWQQPQQQGQAPLDILGLADKAASVVQQLTGQSKPPGSNQSYSAPPPPHSHYSSGPPGSNQMPTHQGHHGSQMPYSNAPNSSTPYNPMNPHGGNYNDNRPPSSQQGGGPPNKPRRGRATTTAALGELPPMVQYAVQNLQNTRQVDHALDGGILGMIKDLPEPLALAALQKFSSCDKNTMRNKTAYLAGVLRRELERINRR